MKLFYKILFFLFFSHFAMAQNSSVDKEIKKIDSLIYYNQFKEAEKKLDNLYVLLKDNDKKEVTAQKLELRYQKALITDNQFDHGNSLPIFMEVLQGANRNKLYKLSCKTNIRIAFNQEKANNYYLAYQYLNTAMKLIRKYNFPELKSTIYIRYSLIHKFLADPNLPQSNKELIGHMTPPGYFKIDSAFYYAKKAVEFAEKYKNEYDVNEANLTLGILEADENEDRKKAIKYYLKTIPYWKKVRNYEYIGNMYNNISISEVKLKEFKTALKYSDSAYQYYDDTTLYYKWVSPRIRGICFEKLGNIDSAYHYIKIAYDKQVELYQKEEVIKTKNLEEQYQNDKKEAEIKRKNQQMISIAGLLTVIIFGSVVLFRKNREISRKNKIINKQLAELSKTLEQKQVLLSELQHRVKNNLQHVISILEIQKESVDFNNIDELIRGNQNRIHSMALLHKKLNVADNVNDVDLKRYVTELSELVKESYDNHKKKITLNTKCEIEEISIEKALPIGLIITELVSNSMKHAFKNRNIGIITIEIAKDEKTGNNQLYYSDNGDGFDFNKNSEKGLGQEIIKGLIDQLNGTTETKSSNGFELTIYFK